MGGESRLGLIHGVEELFKKDLTRIRPCLSGRSTQRLSYPSLASILDLFAPALGLEKAERHLIGRGDAVRRVATAELHPGGEPRGAILRSLEPLAWRGNSGAIR